MEEFFGKAQNWFGETFGGLGDWFKGFLSEGKWTGPATLLAAAGAMAVAFFTGRGLFGNGVVGTLVGSAMLIFVGLITAGGASRWFEGIADKKAGEQQSQGHARVRQQSRDRGTGEDYELTPEEALALLDNLDASNASISSASEATDIGAPAAIHTALPPQASVNVPQ